MHFAMFLIVRTVSAGDVHIQGVVRNAGGESLQCTIVSTSLYTGNLGVVLPLQSGQFHHRFEVSGTTFLSFSDGANYFGGFVEPGDSIVIHYDKSDFANSISYHGAGKEKFEITSSINQMKVFVRKAVATAKLQSFPVDYMFASIDSLKDAVNKNMTLFRNSMSRESHMQLLGYLSATELLAKHNSLAAIFGDSYNHILTKHQDKLSEASKQSMQKLLIFDEAHYNSRFYADAVKVLASIYLEENVQPQTSDYAERKYQLLASFIPGKLRSPVIFLTLKSDISNSTNAIGDPVLQNAIEQLADQRLKEILTGMLAETTLIREGDFAPEISVQNLSGEKVSLASFRGKTVYLDFWFAACGPCHALFKSIEPVKKQFENDDRVVFLTVSVDNQTTWKKAITKFGVKGYHVFTEDKLREHPIIKSYNVSAFPTTYIIAPNGRFYSLRPSNNPEILGRQIEESTKLPGK